MEDHQFQVLLPHLLYPSLQLAELKGRGRGKKHQSEQGRKLMAVFKKNDGGKYRKQSIAHSALRGPDRNFTVS